METMIKKALLEHLQHGDPLRIGVLGAGFMGLPAVNQITRYMPGMRVAAVASRNVDNAIQAYQQAGVSSVVEMDSMMGLQRAIAENKPVVCADGLLLCQADGIDVVLDMTGNAEFAAQAALTAFQHGKHFITYSEGLLATAASILDLKAQEAGVMFSMADGDQPGVIMNLWHFVRSIGVTPLVCGNIKGLQDPYRTPVTQEGFARQWGQKAHMVSSYADGTKMSFEMSIIANATDMRVPKRGMNGFDLPVGFPVEDLTNYYNYEELAGTNGIVDYVVGASPAAGIYVIGATQDPVNQKYLRLYKLGEGPLYSFYRPYHLCHMEVPYSIARIVLMHDPVLTATGPSRVVVVAIAKRDLKAGETLDGIGHYMTYGECENTFTADEEGLLPIIFAEGARLLRDVAKDQPVRLSDVSLPKGGVLYDLYQQQQQRFPPEP